MSSFPVGRNGRPALSFGGGAGRSWMGAIRVLVLGALLIGLWAATYRFGPLVIGTHSFYLAILLAAYWFGSLGAIVVGLASAVLAGPLMPLDPSTGLEQQRVLWMSRALAYQLVGQLAAWFMERSKAASSLDKTREFVANLNSRLSEDPALARQRSEAIERIKEVIDDPNSIHVVFQPMVDLSTNRPVAMEALSRFTSPPRRGPDKWFEEAWTVGLGIELELTALKRAASLIERLPGDCLLAVNVSPDTVISAEFAELITSLPAERLILELTEHSPIDEYLAVSEALREFRRRGGRLAIDDAGAGYASFRHVLELYPDIIKLDIQLTRRVESDAALRALTQSMVRLGFELNAMIVAEGVETPEQLAALQDLGVKYGQGFYLSRPAPIRIPEASPAGTVLPLPSAPRAS